MSNLISKSITPIDSTLPVSVLEVRADLRIDYPITDTQIENYIRSSMAKLQELTCLVFVPSNVVAVYTQCGDQITLGYCNGIDENSITGTPDDGVLIGAGEQWYLRTTEELVKLEYTAGYTTLPDWAKQAITLDVCWRLEHYGDDQATLISPEAINLIQPFRAYIPL